MSVPSASALVPLPLVNGSRRIPLYICGYKELEAVPQPMLLSMRQQVAYRTGCGTDILVSVGQVSIVLEGIVL